MGDPRPSGTPFASDGRCVIWRGDGETLVVEAWGANGVRVRSRLSGPILDNDFALLSPAYSPEDAVVEIDGNRAELRVGRITARLHAVEYVPGAVGSTVHYCRIEFLDRHGDPLLSEISAGGALNLVARRHRPRLGGDVELTAAFETAPDEKLYGMGQYQQEVLDLKGSVLELAHRNSQSSVPFVLSSRGYGFLWHNPAIGRAVFGRNRTEWTAEATQQLDYWVTAGDSPAEITRAYADATGHAPMMPEWGLGYWQCKLRYANQEQLLEVAREFRRRELPIDVIVADFFHWPRMGDWRFDEEFWPDPAAMVAELRELGIELMVSVWPQVSYESENFAEMRRRNLLVRAERGIDVQMWFQGPSVFLDPTNPETRAFVWETVRRNYGAHGIRAFWLDEAEPEFGVYDWDNYRYHLGSASQVGNLYPQAYSRLFHEGQTAEGQTEVVNLVRSVWAGSQRYGALAWSGDIHATFEALRQQITAAIHMGVAGIPWFTTDIGGFAGGTTGDPAFHELLVRWFQFGAFSPVMRMHGDRAPHTPLYAADGSARMGTGAANEPWSFGAEVEAILTRYLTLRELLRPYLRATMRGAHEDGQPVLRGLFHEFPDDPECWDAADQFLLGPDVLVAPVVHAGARSRTVLLPAGADWTDAASGTVHPGGNRIEVAAPLDRIPVFLRDGALPELVGQT